MTVLFENAAVRIEQRGDNTTVVVKAHVTIESTPEARTDLSHPDLQAILRSAEEGYSNATGESAPFTLTLDEQGRLLLPGETDDPLARWIIREIYEGAEQQGGSYSHKDAANVIQRASRDLASVADAILDRAPEEA